VDVFLPAGDMVIPFSFQLPPDMPSSIARGDEYVAYSIYANIDVAWKQDPSTRAFFTVMQPHPAYRFLYPLSRGVNRDLYPQCCIPPFCCFSFPLTCFDSLPPHGQVFQIGVMLPRQSESNSVRLCVDGISNDQILEYLSNIGWTYPLTDLNDLLSELSQFVDVIRLNFSVKDVVHPKIGLECYIDKQPKNTPKWQLFLDYLVNMQLCTPEKANAVLKWPGYSEEKYYQEVWPINFAKASAFVYPGLKSTIARTLHHIKIVYHPHQPLQAKAYLWFSHRWLSNNGLFQV
jgi:hypothetical protein